MWGWDCENIDAMVELMHVQQAENPCTYTIFSDELLAELLRIFNNDALDQVGGYVIVALLAFMPGIEAALLAQKHRHIKQREGKKEA